MYPMFGEDDDEEAKAEGGATTGLDGTLPIVDPVLASLYSNLRTKRGFTSLDTLGMDHSDNSRKESS